MNPIKDGSLADAESSALVLAALRAPGARGFYGTRFAEISFDSAMGSRPATYYRDGVEIDEAALRQFVSERIGRAEFCLLCELGIADIHSATRAAAARLGMRW